MGSNLHESTQGWESRAGGGPLLRGRHAPAPAGSAMLHFLPGNGFCGGVYWPFLRRFLPGESPGRGFGLFLHDIEGHGESEVPAHFSGISAVARRVPLVAREQGIDDGRGLIGIGHSFGAALTLKIAADNPGMFRALVLLDPIMFTPPLWVGMRAMAALGAHPMVKGARRRRREWPSREEAIARLRGRGIYKGWTDEALASFVDHATREDQGRRLLCCPPALEAEIYARPVYPWPALRKVDLPILYLHGASSYPFFPASARYARRCNPKVVVRTVAGQHCFMQERPAEAQAAVSDFLRENKLL
ncbi:MAG TPA: alpha/beta hydrolase [Verrucomicrobiae bacterium]|nr:alpha/beta hydrolase [Verrucomicrobiae bacterium]